MAESDDIFFGKIALNKGYISKELLTKALRYQAGLAVHQPLGEILLEKKVLSQAQIQDVLNFQRTVQGQRPTSSRHPAPQRQTPTTPHQGYSRAPHNPNTQGSAWNMTAPQPTVKGSGAQRLQQQQNAFDSFRPAGGPAMESGGINAAAAGPRDSGRVRKSKPKVTYPGVDDSVLDDEGKLNIVGKVIGSCVITEKIGQGGMGSIYLARHTNLNKQVVIKILPPKAAQKKKNLDRFVREAQAAARIEHPNIVQVHTVDKAPEGLYYISMQYVKGKNLNELITAKGRYEWREALRLMTEVARGLRVAHNNNVVHRDIKAENIMVTDDGVAKIADFGLARDLDSDLKLTADGAFIGTPLYMAPEIGRVPDVDGRVDIFSLGVTFYYMVTGVQPFRGFKTMEILSARAHDRIKPPEKHVTDLPEELRKVLGKMLCKDRDRRYLDMDELIDDLERLGRGEPVKAPDPELWGAGGGSSKPGKPSRRSRPPAEVSGEENLLQNPMVWVIGFALAISVVLIALIIVLINT